MRTPIFALALLASACATDRVEWGDETPADRDVIVKDASQTQAPVTAADYAAKFPTDSACESEARRISTKSPDLAVRLIKACVARGDFRRLAAIVDAPWSSTWKGDKEAADVCARVVAARAGDVEADVKACADMGIPVLTLQDMFDAGEKAKGKVCVVRARADADVKEKGDRVRLIETAIESGELETQPTGRRMSAKFGTKRVPPSDAIFVLQGVKVADDTVVNDGEFVLVADVTTMLPAAKSPTFER